MKAFVTQPPASGSSRRRLAAPKLGFLPVLNSLLLNANSRQVFMNGGKNGQGNHHMHINQQLLLFSLGFAAVAAQADESFTDHFRYEPTEAGYAANTFNVDVFGGVATRGRNGEDDAKFEYGAGVNYFITRNVGIDVHTYADAFRLPYNLNVSGIYRYPIEGTAFAPYGFGGIGRQWEFAPQWLGHVGLGGEFRLNQNTGLFVDWRRVFAFDTQDYSLYRFGVRIGF